MPNGEPFYVVHPVWLLGSPHGNYLFGVHDGVEYLVAFTDLDLAERWKAENDRGDLHLGRIGDGDHMVRLLETMGSQGVTHIGFDPKADDAPTRMFLMSDVIEGVRAEQRGRPDE